MMNKFPYLLYLVISEAGCFPNNFLSVTAQAIAGGVDIVQLREKWMPREKFLENALRLQEILCKKSVPLIINDNLGIAQQVNAFGIHVGLTDVPPTQIRTIWPSSACIGYSIEALDQLYNADTMAADYLGISPVFKSNTKSDTTTEWGLAGIEKIRTLTSKPLIAIGNMNKSNVESVITSGADCIAVVSAICKADNPQKAAYQIKNEIEKAI